MLLYSNKASYIIYTSKKMRQQISDTGSEDIITINMPEYIFRLSLRGDISLIPENLFGARNTQ